MSQQISLNRGMALLEQEGVIIKVRFQTNETHFSSWPRRFKKAHDRQRGEEDKSAPRIGSKTS
jgi:hypothetical protein